MHICSVRLVKLIYATNVKDFYGNIHIKTIVAIPFLFHFTSKMAIYLFHFTGKSSRYLFRFTGTIAIKIAISISKL